ncbi:DDB1- and CUL4-associated factor 8 [Hypsibius exemplaris]|uniref:DDB1- and CUL4-associated factor 8 n=1 Tax=Hypsibius exemplaris TaxID=2072580 RepID=A0A1W0WBP1_HYPEX|nr:DDB1- and CUL4-associated factor 8 [Hypsibius exemplaris]
MELQRDGHGRDDGEEWETDSSDDDDHRRDMDNLVDTAVDMLDRAAQEKRKHRRVRTESSSFKRRLVGSRGGSTDRDAALQQPDTSDEAGGRTEGGASDDMPALEGGDLIDDEELPPALESADSDDDDDEWDSDNGDGDERMEVDDDEEEEVALNSLLSKDPVDAKLLIAPVPPVVPAMSIPALLLAREFSGLTRYVAPALQRQRWTGHREILQRFALWANLEGHTGCVNALNFNPTGTLLASGSDDLQIMLWDWSRKKLNYSFASGHHANVFQSKFMPLSNDSLIVTASRDGQIRLAELSSAGGKPATKVLCRHQGACHKIDVRADASHCVLTCGEDAVVYNVDIREAKSNKTLTVMEKIGESRYNKVPLYSVHSNPLNACQFIVSGYDRFVRSYDQRFVKPDAKGYVEAVTKFCPQQIRDSSGSYSVSSAVFNYSGSEILASYNDYNIFLFKNSSDPTACTVPVQEYEGHRNNQTVKSVNFYGPRSEFVVSGSDCGKVLFWDHATARIVHFLEADGVGAVNVLESHPTDPMFATSGLEHSVKIWAPIAVKKADLTDLIPVIEKHRSDRKREFRGEGRHMVDEGQFFMMLMNHLQRRNNRARRSPHPRANVDDNPDAMPDLEENSDDEGEPRLPDLPNCPTS